MYEEDFSITNVILKKKKYSMCKSGVAVPPSGQNRGYTNNIFCFWGGSIVTVSLNFVILFHVFKPSNKISNFTHLSSFVSDQSGERLGVEAAVAEAQTSIHAVSRQLQSLLTDVVLVENHVLIRLTRS